MTSAGVAMEHGQQTTTHDREGILASESSGQSFVVVLAGLYTAFVVYGSLVPFRLQPLDLPMAFEHFRTIFTFPPKAVSRSDFASNLLLFVPLSFLWSAVLFPLDRPGAVGKFLGVLIACLGLGIGIEFLQVWFPPRHPNLNDVGAQLLGALAGLAVWQTCGAALMRLFHRAVGRLPGPKRLVWWLFVYYLGLAVWSLLPLDLTISVTAIHHKYNNGMIRLVPFGYDRTTESVTSLMTAWGWTTLQFVPIGFWTAKLCLRQKGARPIAIAVSCAALLGLLLESGKVAVISVSADVTAIIFAGLGGAAGGYLACRWRSAPSLDGADGEPARDARSDVSPLVTGLSLFCHGLRRALSVLAIGVMLIVSGIALMSVLFSSDMPGGEDSIQREESPPRAIAAARELADAVASPPAPTVRRRFGRLPADPFLPVMVEPLDIPAPAGAHAIWGALGQDSQGQIWFAVSARAGPNASAHLFSFDCQSRRVLDRGDVLEQLALAGVRQAHECQMKIHSRIVEAADGYLYFASMDEQGEHVDGSRLPDWGSHVWRIRPSGERWEHVAAVREALIAVCSMGRYVYALGYFDHILYQYDTQEGTIRRIRVGAAGGHISRNFLSDAHEHVYVPRVVRNSGDAAAGPFQVELVEFDARLNEVGRTSLEHYGATSDDSSHGITGVVHLADASIVFATHPGRLYHVQPRPDQPARVSDLGWFHPDGTASTESLFTFSGERYVAGVGRRAGQGFEWLVYDLRERSSRAVSLRLTKATQNFASPYGSDVQDEQGCFYVAGSAGGLPQLVRIHRGDSLLAITNSPTNSPSAEANRPGDPSNSIQLILGGTGRDWTAATPLEKRAVADLLALWLQPGAPEDTRRQLASRYVAMIDMLASAPEAGDSPLADWLPIVHGLVTQDAR